MAEQWISADAAKRMTESDGQQRAVEFIIELASMGLVRSIATSARGAKNYNNFMSWDWKERDWPIPEWFWDNYGGMTEGERDWELGRLSGICYGPDGLIWLELRGVQFSCGELEASLRSARLPARSSLVAQVGRRPKYDWPAAIIAVFGQIFRGDLKPENQADVEAALQAHFLTRDSEPAESTLRPYAKLIWDEAQKA
ncbi:hypothetical protein GRI89_00055 [Altererythrobacter salegens]|uniref:Uncharacterized protein n=1 Tax=Croceibacterium salegens TaxID=1737568 RepID=A0A6I4SS52_9SPHN|nr:hypothetical protein [Croceibacterium salegens]MXO57940.1 hypothetical protein [Croceibacterium salegens]